MRVLLYLLGTAVGLYLVACAAMWLLQEKLVYYGGGAPSTEPKDHGLPGSAIFLKTDDGVRLGAWWIEAERARGAVLFLHGNAGSVENRVEHARAFLAMGFSTLIVDWRGYGMSSGSPSEDGTYRDAIAGYEHLVRSLEIPPARIAVFGESLGGGPAIELALKKPFGALILQSTFTSIPDVGARHYPWLPVKALARVEYANLEKIPRVPVPVLFLHSKEGDIVPYSHAEALHAAALPPKALVTTAGKHEDAQFFLREEWKIAVQGALENMLRGKVQR